MKKTLLSLLAASTLALSSYGQGLVIYLDGGATDVSGQEQTISDITFDAFNEHLEDFIINNNDASAQDWVITREILNETSGWSNTFCWGVNGAAGNCYPASTDISWTSPSQTIPAGGAGKLSTYVNAPTSGTATYRYHISTDGATFLDFVDVTVTSVLGVDNKPSISVNVSPNPATSYVNVKADGVNSASVTLVDVLGNIVLNETMTGSKTINVSEFKNGIYFLRIEAEGVEAITRKIIVRH